CPSTSDQRRLHSFPTRRSSDLELGQRGAGDVALGADGGESLWRGGRQRRQTVEQRLDGVGIALARHVQARAPIAEPVEKCARQRSEEHTSELQSRFDVVCRLLL